MKLLHVIDKMNPKRGGVCQAVRTMIGGLNEFGVENEVVSLDSPNEGFINQKNFLIHALGPSNNYWSFNRKLVPWLLNNLNNFDVVIVHGLWQYPSYAIHKVHNQLKKQISLHQRIPKVYVMPHGMLDPYFQTASGRKLKAIRNTIYWALLEKNSVNNADGVLFTCETECVSARVPFKPYSPKRELTVGMGVESPPIYTSQMKIAFKRSCGNLYSRRYLLFLSRIHEKKGIDVLLQAYAQLKAEEVERSGKETMKFLSTLPKLVIAGPGLETSYGKKIQDLVSDNKLLRENVLLTDMLSGDAKWGAFYGCEAFILPSHQENFGIAIVEAMGCGKPVIITDKVNIWREIKSAGAGLISEDTQAGIYNSLKKWSNVKELKKVEMQENALECFRKEFAVRSASKRLFKVLSA